MGWYQFNPFDRRVTSRLHIFCHALPGNCQSSRRQVQDIRTDRGQSNSEINIAPQRPGKCRRSLAKVKVFCITPGADSGFTVEDLQVMAGHYPAL